jgi:hypothetical protein
MLHDFGMTIIIIHYHRDAHTLSLQDGPVLALIQTTRRIRHSAIIIRPNIPHIAEKMNVTNLTSKFL